jgi:RNA polymerase sigma-70 factor (ECF subfamily)
MVAYFTRLFGPSRLELAEEVVQEALIRALQQWPHHGVPDNAAGWLLTVARNLALDALRRDTLLRARAPQIAGELTRDVAGGAPDDAAFEREVRDDQLAMIFLCCHPALSRDARVALSLKTVSGFSVREIARAFLADEQAIAQRLVRAKRQLRDAGVAFELPTGAGLSERLEAVLDVLYLLFNEGYAAHDGENLVRQDLCVEALRLARLLASAPATGTPAVHALAALMAFQAARLPARVDREGKMVLLADQDRTSWDRALIALGFHHFTRAADGPALTEYHVQSAIAAAHAQAESDATTDWPLILALYDDLVAINPSPVVRLNRAVAVARTRGAAAGLDAIDGVRSAPALRRYYLLPATCARLCEELGDRPRAAALYREALACPCSEPERRFLQERLASCSLPSRA